MPSKKILMALFITLPLTIGCEQKEKVEDVVMLTPTELARYKHLQELYEPKLQQAEQYEAEVARIDEVTKTYINDHIQLKDFSFYKTDGFDDGRERACYRGQLLNTGTEIVDQIKLKASFKDSETKSVIKTWEHSLVFANDEKLALFKPETRAAILALQGKQLPLKANSSLDLQKEKNCMAEVFLGWSVDAIDYELTELELRPKIEEVNKYEIMDSGFYEMKMLENRAKKFGQID